jgi:hypothetical protein
MGVVDGLEVIDVCHDQQRGLAHAGHPVDFAGQRGFELPAVGQPGERVTAGQVAQAIDQGLHPGPRTGLNTVGRTPARLGQQGHGIAQIQHTLGNQRGVVRYCKVTAGGCDGSLHDKFVNCRQV